MNENGLDERKTKILNAIIQNYLETGEPVGSRTISKYTDLKLEFGQQSAMKCLIWKKWDISYSRIHRQAEFLPIKDTGFMSII